MHIALLRVDLHIPDSHSLKDKRSVLKRLMNLIRTHHNVAAAELDKHDTWQSARLGLVTINHSPENTDRKLQRVIHAIGQFNGCELENYDIEKF